MKMKEFFLRLDAGKQYKVLKKLAECYDVEYEAVSDAMEVINPFVDENCKIEEANFYLVAGVVYGRKVANYFSLQEWIIKIPLKYYIYQTAIVL